jgi:eukaryotic-like serine/threonine-protein kinase
VQEGAPARIGDRYEIVRELGRGGMGVVLLARDRRLAMEVALKIRAIEHGDATLWLKREFRAAATLRHPNLVELYELVADASTCYFTMEYVPGVDPRRWVVRAPPRARSSTGEPLADDQTRTVAPLAHARTEASLPPAGPALTAQVPRVSAAIDFARVNTVLVQLAEGLAFLHASGVIHRDVKPSNTLVVEPGEGRGAVIKLLDFGLALERHRQQRDLAREGRIVGTAAYLAPEYIERLTASPAMDVYALGVLAFELVTGAPPLGGTLHVVARLARQLEIPRASALNPEVPAELDELIHRMLEADPARRPSALEVVGALAGDPSRPRSRDRALRFVGRATELAAIRAAIAEPQPRGRLLVVTGPSGAGKSALVAEACRHAGEALVWRTRCHERERLPFRAFDLLIDELAIELASEPGLVDGVEHAAALARVFPVLAAVLHEIDPAIATAPAASDLRVERERALVAVAELFRHLLRAPCGVIAIDDLQWADEDSLELLAVLVERVARPLTVIVSWTIGAAPPGVAVGSEPTRSPALEALLARLAGAWAGVEVTAMPEAELATLVAEIAPRAPAAQIADAARSAAGSPYLAELIAEELADGDLAGAPAISEARRLARLARLAPAQRAIVELAATATGALSFEQLAMLAGVPAVRLVSILRELEHARIVRAMPSVAGDPVFVLYHQRLRTAADAAMPPERARARHEQHARWYEQAGRGDHDRLAYHWQHAGDRARAAHWAITAGDAAYAQLAWTTAAEWYRRALAELPRGPGSESPFGGAARPNEAGPGDRTSALPFGSAAYPGDVGARALALRGKLAESLALAGKLADAAHEFLALASAMPGDTGDRWRVCAAEAYLKRGEIDRGLTVLDDVLERRGERRSRTRTLSVVRAAAVAARWLASPPGGRARGEDPILASAYRAIASFVSTPHPVEALEYVLRQIALADRMRDSAAQAHGMAMLAAYLAAATLGRLGDRALVRAEQLAATSGAPYPRMVTAGCAGIQAMLRGDWDGMRAAHAEGERVCHRLGLERSWEASFLRSYWALGELYAGEPAHALALLDDIAATSDDLFGRAIAQSYRGRALVMQGELATARALAAELARSAPAGRGMAALHRRVFEAELALAEHDWTRATHLAGELAAAARAQWLSVMPAISAMVEVVEATAALGRARQGDRAAARHARTTALRLYRRGARSFYAATALRLAAQADRLLGHHRSARDVLVRAAAIAHARGGKVERLAIAALAGETIDPGPLASAIGWTTGGALGRV